MIEPLPLVWKQFEEAHAALRQALAEVPDERLLWRPPGAKGDAVATIVQDVARANAYYAHLIEHGGPVPPWEMEESPGRDRLLERLAESEQQVREAFERMTPNSLRQPRAEKGWALGLPADGPLDALWFAMEIVRHACYHVGQLHIYRNLWEAEDGACSRAGG